jgi:hypothetical protein
MAHRYHLALAKGQKAYVEAVEEDRKLLHMFGLRLLSVDGVVRAAVESELKGTRVINPWNVVEIDMKTWEVFRPALVEARDARKAQRVPALALAAK